MSTATDTLWRQYRADGDAGARAELLDRYLGLVHHCARQIANRIGGAVELEDLVNAGTLGLVKALDSFDLGRGLAFSTYAMQRIRGAILDELRALDWLPRSVRAKGRKINQVVATLERSLARAPRPDEVATALGVDLETYWRWREEVGGGAHVSLDGQVALSERSTGPLADTIADPDAPGVDESITKEEGLQMIRDAVAELPDRERAVLAMYYFEELNLRQIAEILHVTESRISQIRTRALQRLRGRLSPQEVF